MLQHFNQKRGQSTLEYAVLIVVIIGALLSIQVYMKRGIQGRLKQASDDIGDQYSGDNTNMITVTNRSSNTVETFNAGNSSTNTLNEVTNTQMNSLISNAEYENWGSSAGNS